MKFYINLDEDNYIIDCITFEYKDYVMVTFETPLPHAFISGIYKYLGDNKFELDEAKAKEVLKEGSLEEILEGDDDDV